MRGDSHCGVFTGSSPLPETVLNVHLCPSGGKSELDRFGGGEMEVETFGLGQVTTLIKVWLRF